MSLFPRTSRWCLLFRTEFYYIEIGLFRIIANSKARTGCKICTSTIWGRANGCGRGRVESPCHVVETKNCGIKCP